MLGNIFSDYAIIYFVRPNTLWFYRRDEGLMKRMSAEPTLLENNPPRYPVRSWRRVGFIVVGEHMGVVEKISIKTTRIRALQGYVRDPEYQVYMDINQAILFDLKRRFEEARILFAYPTRMIYVKQE